MIICENAGKQALSEKNMLKLVSVQYVIGTLFYYLLPKRTQDSKI